GLAPLADHRHLLSGCNVVARHQIRPLDEAEGALQRVGRRFQQISPTHDGFPKRGLVSAAEVPILTRISDPAIDSRTPPNGSVWDGSAGAPRRGSALHHGPWPLHR